MPSSTSGSSTSSRGNRKEAQRINPGSAAKIAAAAAAAAAHTPQLAVSYRLDRVKLLTTPSTRSFLLSTLGSSHESHVNPAAKKGVAGGGCMSRG